MSKVVLITGAARGIGAATARLAARRGYAVAVNYRRSEATANALVDAIQRDGGDAALLPGDVTDETTVKNLFDTAEQAFGPVTALVNNAGITGRSGPLHLAAASTMSEVMQINVLGSMLCAREAVRRMSTERAGRGGAIVNISSAAATLGSANTYVWYAASKGAIDSLTVGLAREVATQGIRVNAVAPGVIDTDIHDDSGVRERVDDFVSAIPMRRLGTAAEVAESILWLLSDAASYCTGAILRVAGGR